MDLVITKISEPAASWRTLSVLRPRKIVSCLVLFTILAFCPGFVSAQATESPSRATKPLEIRATNDLKVGLVLGGGGARGAAHVGVLKILEQEGIQIDYIAGTNIGAIVGGLYSAGVSIDHLEDMFSKESLMHAYLTVPIKLRLMVVPLFYIPRLAGKKGYDGLYQGNLFRKFLNKYVPESEQEIADLKIPFGAVALNLVDGKTVTLRSGNLGTALQASSAIPILRKPVKIQDGLYVDGGVVCNLPVTQVKEMGADLVIAVCLDDLDKKIPPKDFSRIGTVSQRVVSLHLKNVDKEQARQAHVLIRPEVDQISLMSTKSADAKTALQAGERAALESLDEIKRLLKEAQQAHDAAP